MPGLNEPGWWILFLKALRRTCLHPAIALLIRKLYEDSTGMRFKDFDFHALGQSHIDAAWRWRRKDSLRICRETFEKVCQHLDEFPGFTFLQPSPQYYSWMKESFPDLYERIKGTVRAGRWFPVGGMWVEPDLRIPSGESLVRQRLYGQRFYKEEFGEISRVSFLPDSFGFPNSLPQILVKSGARAFVTHKPLWNAGTIFPFGNFLWRGCDGTEILTHIADIGYTLFAKWKTHGFQRLLLRRGRKLIAGYDTPDEKIMDLLSDESCLTQSFGYGAGDGGHGPLYTELVVVDALDRLGDVHFSSPEALADSLGRESARFPVWSDEIYLELHRGTLTTQGWIKRQNRRAEETMTGLEFLWTLNYLQNGEYPGDELARMWKLLLFNQFHDILPGTSIPEAYDDAAADFTEFHSIGKGLEERGLGILTARIHYKSKGELLQAISRIFSNAPRESGLRGRDLRAVAITVVNPKSIPSRAPVMVDLDGLSPLLDGIGGPEPREGLLFIDSEGHLLEHQIVGEPHEESVGPSRAVEPPDLVRVLGERKCLLFIADLPPLGYETVYVVKAGEMEASSGMGGAIESPSEIVLENPYLRVVVNRHSGNITSIRSKALELDALIGEGDNYLLFDETGGDAWNIPQDYRERRVPYDPPVKVELLEDGSVRSSVLVLGSLAGSPYLKRIGLYRALDGVYMGHVIHWRGHNRILKVSFPLAFQTTPLSRSTADCPFGVISRALFPTTERDRARWEVSCQKWISLGPDDGRYSFTLVNDSKYGYSVNGNALNLTLLRGPRYPGPSEEAHGVDAADPRRSLCLDADQLHHIETALYVNKGPWNSEAKSSGLGESFNTRTLTAIVPIPADRKRRGTRFPDRYSLARTSNPAVSVAATKAPEDKPREGSGEDHSRIVMRLFNHNPEPEEAKIEFDLRPIERIVSLDLLEMQEEGILKPTGSSFDVDLGPFEIKTLRIDFLPLNLKIESKTGSSSQGDS